MSINDKEWSRVVADSLRDAEIDVSDQLWSRIEVSIEPMPVHRGGRVVRLLSAAAAVVVFGVAGWMAYQLSKQELSSYDAYVADETEVDVQIDANNELILDECVEIGALEMPQTQSVVDLVEQHVANKDIVIVEDEDIDMEVEATPTIPESTTPVEERITQREPAEKVYRKFTPPTKSRSNQSTMIALNMAGAGASLSSSSLGYINQHTLQVHDVHSYDNGTDYRFLDIYQNSDISHRQPFAVALSAGYYISNNFMLVGGVSYSVLVSDLTMKHDDSEMVQRLQFIGVPIRIDYSFLNTHRVMLYGGIGGGVEYLLSAKVDDVKIDEKRWHYSISSAIGAEYKFTDWLGVYAEPEVSYYLNNTKLETIRTDSPLSFTLRVGVRFAL